MVILCIFLCVACYYDYRYSRIPNWLTSAAFAAGVAAALAGGGMASVLSHLGPVILVIAAFYPLFRLGTLGAGDVKLFGVCAGYLPGGKILKFLFFSMLFAAIISLIRIIRQPDPKERFLYFCEYIRDVAESGRWKLYFEDKQEQRRAGICLAGPILLSALLYMGGLY